MVKWTDEKMYFNEERMQDCISDFMELVACVVKGDLVWISLKEGSAKKYAVRNVRIQDFNTSAMNSSTKLTSQSAFAYFDYKTGNPEKPLAEVPCFYCGVSENEAIESRIAAGILEKMGVNPFLTKQKIVVRDDDTMD